MLMGNHSQTTENQLVHEQMQPNCDLLFTCQSVRPQKDKTVTLFVPFSL